MTSRVYERAGAYRALHNGYGGYRFEVMRKRRWLPFGTDTSFARNASVVLGRLNGYREDTPDTPPHHWRRFYGVDEALKAI